MISRLKKYGTIAFIMGLPYLGFSSTISPNGDIDLEITATDQDNLTRHCTSLANCSIITSRLFSFCLPQLGSITIKNNSQIIAKNIQASSSNPNYLNYVVANNGCPPNLLPGGACSISFYTNNSVSFFAPNIMVKGSNTNTTYFDMQAIPCTITFTTITPSDSGIVLYDGDPAVFTITNNGPVPAYDISATSSSSYFGISNDCPSALGIGMHCTFTVTVTNPLAYDTDITVSGVNTNTTVIGAMVY